MYSAWGSLELVSKCQKPVVVTLLVWCLTTWGVLPGGLECVAWWLGVCCLAAWGVLPDDKGKLEKLGTHDTWRKM